MIRTTLIFIIIFLLSSCKINGTYYWNGNSYADNNYLVLNEDQTFLYSWSNHIAGNYKIYGSWKKTDDIFYLKESDLKFKNNQIVNVEKKERNYIKVVNPKNEPLSFMKIKINDKEIGTTNFDGICYINNQKIVTITVIDGDSNILLGTFTVSFSRQSSYEVVIDYKTIIKSSCNNCPFKLKRKGNKFYPFDENNEIDKKYFFRKKK